jgi:hypothetical protein
LSFTYLYHSLGTLNRIHIHVQCVINWNTGISYAYSRACPLIGSFCPGFTYCDDRERDSNGNVIFRCSFIGYILWSFILRYQGTCFYVWLWYKNERTSKHSTIWFILGGYAPSYKSDSLVFRCSFYYLKIHCPKIL